jgi:hypothetical protein
MNGVFLSLEHRFLGVMAIERAFICSILTSLD